MQQALHYRQIGDLSQAERILDALHALLDGDESQDKLRDLTENLLEDVRGEMARVVGRDSLLERALERADAKAGEGALAEARKIWAGIIELYDADPQAAAFVKQAREQLEKHRPLE